MNLVRSTVCRVSRPWARNMAIAGVDQAPLVGRHMERCLRCQAEMAIENRISRGLAATGDLLMPAPTGLMAAVIAGLDLAAPPPATNRDVPKIAIAAGLVAVASGLAWTLSRKAKSSL